ncbi:MAG TPA: aldo/keto reductase, partial [Burkholderiaceae bacterium]|nr:aldo/keto reductase [Burkholderiaceae bacterium]
MDVSFPDGESVPALGIGTYRMGESGRLREQEIATLQLALDAGARVIDTAEMYADGGAEKIVGAALRGRRDKAFVVTKVLPSNASRRGVIAACERSLARLAIERIDLYLLHWRGATALAETVEAFEQLVQQGRIARWGVSNFDVDDMRQLVALAAGGRCAANQVYYSASRRGVEFDLLPLLRSQGVPLMAYCPFDEGRILSDRTLAAIARKHAVSPAQVALAWLLSRPGVIAIPKAGRAEHLRENLAAAQLKLDAEDFAQIDRHWPPPARKQGLAIV